MPKAFIEMAWRRYVKHSKNKVQEIAGAILPLVETYAQDMPFYAAVLAGEFTKNSLIQLESQGFYVVHFDYEEICSFFQKMGVSIRWEEDTSGEELLNIMDSFQALELRDSDTLNQHFFIEFADRLEKLAQALCESLDTKISEVVVVPMHGVAQALSSAEAAIDFARGYDESSAVPILRYEIIVRYSNGKEYTMKCSSKAKAIQFLNQYTEK